MRVRNLIIAFIVLPFFNAYSQEQTEEVDSLAADSVESIKFFIPSIYIDYGKLLTYTFENETKIEGGVELLFKEKIPIIVEFGTATLNPNAYSNASYEANGSYIRFGTGIYSRWQKKNRIGLTMRYALSSFDEITRLTGEITPSIRGSSGSFDRRGLTASWLEVVLYTDKILTEWLAVGMNLRYRYLLDYDIQAPTDVFSIPGYGRSFDNSIPAVNLFVKVSF